MRVGAILILMLAASIAYNAPDASAQPPSTFPPSRVTTKRAKPREAGCIPLNATVVSAPPSAVPTISAAAAPGAVNVPVPTPPGAPDPNAESCDADSIDISSIPSGRMRQLARKHPKVVKTALRINTTQPGWTLRADTIVDGSLIGGGAAYRHGIEEDRATFDMMGIVSLNAYYLVTAGFTYARPSEPRLVFHVAMRHESFPEEDFYGFGRNSLDASHTAYWRQGVDSIGGVTFSPTQTVHITGTAGVLNVRMLSGREGEVPSTDDRFTAAEVPGLLPGAWANYLHAGAGVDVDRTDDASFPKGGRYRGSFTRYSGFGEALGLFSRVDLDIRQYVPMPYSKNHVFAIRGLLGAISGADAAAVPFYFLPRLGGNLTLRGYDTGRFTDRDALSFNVEYRVLIKNRLQVLAFTDMGDVAPNLGDLRPAKFHTSQGVGFRFQAGGTFLPGMDIAHGADGWALLVRLGHAF
jgi:hypothetical protein